MPRGSVLLAPGVSLSPERGKPGGPTALLCSAPPAPARPSPAGASVPAAEAKWRRTPNKSSQLRPPEALSAPGSAPPEPARTGSHTGSGPPACARPYRRTAGGVWRGEKKGVRRPDPSQPRPPSHPAVSFVAGLAPPARRPSVRARLPPSPVPPARAPQPRGRAANHNFYPPPAPLPTSRRPRSPPPPPPKGGGAPNIPPPKKNTTPPNTPTPSKGLQLSRGHDLQHPPSTPSTPPG